MQPQTSQVLDSYIPVYDAVPDKWEEAKEFICERFKEFANAINAREIGWFLDQELLSGKILYPSSTSAGNTIPEQNRQVLRKVINSGALVMGANTVPHGITVDSNFTNIFLWVSVSNSTTLTGQTLVGTEVTYDVMNVYINSPAAYDRSNIFFEYIQQV